ncbi:MAG: hypothetical protein ABIS01_02900, partial [Ferruginibacter sp.]
MRLVKQSFLYFKEGNSDKVYEIDLCDVGNDKYIINFRYGKKGTQLKEGSKTPVPLALAEAEKIFDAVETGKINKGYTTSETGNTAIPPKIAFTLDSSTVFFNNNWAILATSRNKAILQRLQHAVSGTAINEQFPWKLSRIIWKAGEYQIKEAVPYIIKLFNAGNQLHQYCCTWSLARCCGDDTQTIVALKSIHTLHPAPSITKIAGVGLVKNLHGLEKETFLNHYVNKLPEALKIEVASENTKELDLLTKERIAQQQPNYNWLEDLYILSTEKRWMRNSLKSLLQQVPLQPNYFKHIRAIFKMAELLDDFEIAGLLACRFEREEEMFRYNGSFENGGKEEVYVPEIEEWVKLQKELKKTNSRLAYSQKTRWYFHSRVLRRLEMTGQNDDLAYVKLATALLIGYKFKEDFRQHYSVETHVWRRNNYERVETRFLQNAQAVFLHQVLSGDNPAIVLQSNHLWRMRADDEKTTASKQANKKAGDGEGLVGLLKKITGFFGKKKEAAVPLSEPVNKVAPQNIPGSTGT